MLLGFQEGFEGLAKLLNGTAKLKEFEQKTGYKVLTGNLPETISKMIESGALDEALKGVKTSDVLKMFDSIMIMLEITNKLQSIDINTITPEELTELSKTAKKAEESIKSFLKLISGD